MHSGVRHQSKQQKRRAGQVAGNVLADSPGESPSGTKRSAMKKAEDILTDAFRRAADAALAADPGAENDGGTCNLDSPAFRWAKKRDATIQKIAKRAGVAVYDFSWFGGQRWYWLQVPLYGQANRRAAMAKAAASVLHELDASGEIEGFEACCYCQMD